MCLREKPFEVEQSSSMHLASTKLRGLKVRFRGRQRSLGMVCSRVDTYHITFPTSTFSFDDFFANTIVSFQRF